MMETTGVSTSVCSVRLQPAAGKSHMEHKMLQTLCWLRFASINQAHRYGYYTEHLSLMQNAYIK